MGLWTARRGRAFGVIDEVRDDRPPWKENKAWGWPRHKEKQECGLTDNGQESAKKYGSQIPVDRSSSI